MKQKDKELLLKDLCARVPYRLKVKCEKYPFPVTVLYAGNIDEVKFGETGGIECIYTIKPYLFPLSNMTEEQKKEESSFDPFTTDEVKTLGDWAVRLVEFYNKYHFDYHGLIEKGLAIDATGLNIY